MTNELCTAINNYNEAINKAITKAQSNKDATSIIRLFILDDKIREDGSVKQRSAWLFLIELANLKKNNSVAKEIYKLFWDLCTCTIVIKKWFVVVDVVSWDQIKKNLDIWLEICSNVSKGILIFVEKIKKINIDPALESSINTLIKSMEKCNELIKLYGTKPAFKARSQVKIELDNMIGKFPKSKDFIEFVNKIYSGEYISMEEHSITQIEGKLKEFFSEPGALLEISGLFMRGECHGNKNKLIQLLDSTKNKFCEYIDKKGRETSKDSILCNKLKSKITKLINVGIDNLKKFE